MSLVIPDFRLIAAILADPNKVTPKRSHRWPAGVGADGYLCLPKMTEGTQHNVYEVAPYGKYGNPLAPPYLIVEIQRIEDSRPSDWTDEEMVHEGFESLEAYGQWWDQWRQGDRNCDYWVAMQEAPFWVCWFEPVAKTEYFSRRAEQYAKENGLL